jgi:hypothetical protein
LTQTDIEAGCSFPKLIRLRYASVFARLPTSPSFAGQVAVTSRRDKADFGFNSKARKLFYRQVAKHARPLHPP